MNGSDPWCKVAFYSCPLPSKGALFFRENLQLYIQDSHAVQVYAAQIKKCVIVVHGGAWAIPDSLAGTYFHLFLKVRKHGNLLPYFCASIKPSWEVE